MVSAIPRIDNMASDDGLFVESLTTALAQTNPEVAERIGEFLTRKATYLIDPRRRTRDEIPG